MVGGAANAKTPRGETSLLRRRLIRRHGLILGMLVAFLVGGVSGMAAFFAFATVASLLTFPHRATAGSYLTLD